jgi:hypothetical protein
MCSMTSRSTHESLQKHFPGILNVFLNLDQKGHSLSTVQKSVVVCKRKIHHLQRRLA